MLGSTEGLPYISAHLPGLRGHLRTRPEDFQVEEIPAYAPSGQGEHTFVRITKRGLTSTEVRDRLAQLFGLSPHDIGMAGLKDRHAVATQTFSIPRVDPEEAVKRIQAAYPDLQVHHAARHTNKLKPGHLKGNRFRVVVRNPEPDDALERARAIAEYLRRVGVPNYYGPQRFGRYGDNAQRGLALLEGRLRLRDRWLRRFLLSALQAALFNAYLARRVQQGWFTQLLRGDIAKKADTGGLFIVENPDQEAPRYQRGEIHFTGPMYGYRLWRAEHEAGRLEEQVLQQHGLSWEAFRRVRLRGTRRLGRLWLQDLHVESTPEGHLVFSFTLPKGAFATTVLREFLRDERLLTAFTDDHHEDDAD